MSNPIHQLVVAQDANSAAYRRLVQTSVPGECWDVLVLTASDEKQAEGYRRELALRNRGTDSTAAFFPAIQKSIVVADPPGRRAGSGGATLGVMKALRRDLGLAPADLRNLRILLIHSGGASRQLPMYAPVGKIFSPLPSLRPDGQIATLFDHLYLTLCGLPEKLGPGMLIVAGDVFLLFDHRHVSTPSAGVSAISMRVPSDLGTDHGVFVTDAEGRIVRTLQKSSVADLAKAGAADAHGHVLIDTGILFFDAPAAIALAKLAGADKPAGKGIHETCARPIDLYEDITFALSSGTGRSEYLKTGERGVRTSLWRAFHSTPFRCLEVSGEFLHLGTTQQFRDAMTGRSSSPAAELFQRNVLDYSQWTLPVGPRVYHSALLRSEDSAGDLGTGSVIEHSILGGKSRIGRDCVVSQAVAVDSPLIMPDETLFFQVPVRVDDTLCYAQVLCGTSDHFANSSGNGQCSFLNGPIGQWLKRHGITPRQVWGSLPAGQRNLWTARLFPVTQKRDDCRQAAWLVSSRTASPATIRRWLDSSRMSMAMILRACDPSGLIEHREVVAAYLQTGKILDTVRRHEPTPVDVIFGHHTTRAAYDVGQRLLTTFAQRPTTDAQEALEQARAQWVASQLLARPSHPDAAGVRGQLIDAMQQSFARVALASELGHRSLVTNPRALKPLPVGKTVEATSPVRLDLTGGWTDTPPYCYEEGGHVINVAIDLDGRPPIRVTVGRTPGTQIVLESRDLGRTLTTSVAQLKRTNTDPRDPFSLLIVALQLTGYLDAQPIGLHITTECRVPKGSGLGTSSVLAATLLAALLRLGGRQSTTDELIELTLLLEQRLSTGGGWQDQVGGLVGGIKSTTSAPGIPQRPIVEQLSIPVSRLDELERRIVVYFSGQQRLARDILRRVEGRWLAREAAAVTLKRELKSSAASLRNALLAGDWPQIAEEVNRYWRIKKQLYPGSTTPSVDVLLLELQGQYRAASIAGAGGGGFGFFVCDSAAEADRLRASLAEHSNRPGSLGSVYETRINRTGLQLTVR